MRFTLLLIMLLNALTSASYADELKQEVKVADPFLEMHTGPSVSYPIFHVIKRDEIITVVKQRTSWYLIEDYKKREGWVHRSQLAKTLTLKDEKIEIKEFTHENYLEHDLEMSMIGGNFGTLPMMTLSGSYAFTNNLAAEVSFSQIIGSFSSRQLLGGNLIHHPFPEWKISPYFSLGTGLIKTNVKSTISPLKDQTDYLANVGLGFKMYLTRRFLLRADVKKHIIFQSRNNNEEITAWQVGFAFFF